MRLDPECVPRLRVLEAADNKIAQWPEDVGGLTELHTLNLANNGLKSLAGTELVAMKRMWMPKRGVHELLGLSILHLPHNEMSELPPTLVSCLLPWLALTLTLTLTSC